MRFNAGPLRSAIQLEPTRLLEHDFVRTIWYLHAQPPGFNALVGILLHVPGGHAGVFGAVYLALGLVLTLTMFALMVELGAPDRLALVFTILFVISPTTVLNETWLLYGYPVAVLLCVAALCFARFARTNRIGYAAGLGAALTVLALSRASYHLVFIVGAGMCVLAVCPRPQWRRALVVVLAPMTLVVGLYVKNEILFGQPTASTWFGMNVAHMMFQNTPPELRADVAAHRLSPQALIVPFAGLGHYPTVPRPHTGVAALDLAGEGGRTNFNNRAYITISDRSLKDAAHYIARHPNLYAARVGESVRTAFTSGSDYYAFHGNRTKIGFVVGLQNRLFGQLHDFVPLAPASNAPGWDRIAWLVVLQYAAVLAAGLALVVRTIRRRGGLGPRGAAFLFLAGTVGYSFLASNLVELGENNRFRFETDPLVCAGVAALIAYGAARRSRARRAEPPTGATADLTAPDPVPERLSGQMIDF